MKKLLILGLMLSGSMGPALASDWITDFEDAREIAAADGKYILINFTGSDWCGWCKRLNREVFRQAEFKAFADANLVLLELDFPKWKKQSPALEEANERLRRRYNVRGFPTILLTDASGRVVLSTGYRRGGAGPYVAHLKAKMSHIN